jgi:hypothetical protein
LAKIAGVADMVDLAKIAGVAQLVEQHFCKVKVSEVRVLSPAHVIIIAMGANNSYALKGYKEKQSQKAKAAWKLRLKTFVYSREKRKCSRRDCDTEFEVSPGNHKRYCSQSCAVTVTNRARGPRSSETRKKISESLKGLPSPIKGTIKIARVKRVCKKSDCSKEFFVERWRKVRFCSPKCAMKVVGGRPTSPKASRGKAGTRKDISSKIYFYSRWEANIARLYNHLGITWEYEPKTFDIGEQMYTPDFYIPKENKYVEVKNFWWRYSKERDEKFRRTYPDVKLDVILKEEYLKLEKRYAHLIPHWEYKDSKFEKSL